MSADPYRAAASRTANRYGIPGKLFERLITQESGWNPKIQSSAGAIGLTQLMPATAASLKVNPLDPIANLDGGARYLRQQYDRFGSWRLALAAYNAGPGRVADGSWQQIPETSNYVRSVMGNVTYRSVPAPRTDQTVTPPPRTPTVPMPPRTSPALPSDALWGTDLVSKAAFENLGKIARGWKPSSTLADLVAASQVPVSTATVPAETASMPSSPSKVPTTPSQPTPPSSGKLGKVITAPGADRSGVRTHQAVRDFVAKVAGVYGSPLTITTGTNHNQYVIGTHRQSQHWTGDAADIAFGHGTGSDNVDPALTKLGQDALIAAGADPEWARKQTGGAFNIGGHNILFNTYVGGNHYNHLHVGV